MIIFLFLHASQKFTRTRHSPLSKDGSFASFVLQTQTILPVLLYMSVTGLQAFTRWGPVENSFLQFIIRRTIIRIEETIFNISHEVYKSSYRVGVRLQGDQVLDLITDTEGYCVHRISAEDYGPENMAFCKYFECFLAVLKHGYS